MIRLRSLALAVFLTLAAAPAAGAATTFTVNTTADGADVCAATCTLRGAIRSANETAGADIVSIPTAGEYKLTLGGAGENANATGDLDVMESLAIQGAGSGVVIDANGLDSAIEGVSATATLDISGVTVRGAPATSNTAITNIGPRLTLTDVVVRDNLGNDAVNATSTAGQPTDLTLTRVLVTNNTVDDDVVEHGPFTDGTLHIQDSQIVANTSDDTLIDADPSGGTTTVVNIFGSDISGNTTQDYGLDVNPSGAVSNATLDVRNSTFRDNRLNDSEGLIDFDPSSFGALTATLRISDTVFSGTRAVQDIGAILIDPSNGGGNPLTVDARLDRVRFEDNLAGGGAPGEDGDATIVLAPGNPNGANQQLAINDSVFLGNESRGEDARGGALLLTSGGARTVVTNSTFARNRAGTVGTESVGGAIAITGASLEVVNSTFDGNAANAGDSDTGGGAIYASGAELRVVHSTLTGNGVSLAPGEPGPPSGTAGGGALLVRSGATATVTGSILHGNTAFGNANDCLGTVGSGGSNIEGGSSCGFTSPLRRRRADQQGVADPGLLPLADNGGLSPTRALTATSPARDAAAAATCPATDQRGIARPQEAGCDIGAFEYVPPPPEAPVAEPPPVVAPPLVPPPPRPSLLLSCQGASLALVDVVRRAGRVRITGQAAPTLVGQQIGLFVSSRRNRRVRPVRVGRTTVKPDGTFAATVPKPPRRIRSPQYFARTAAGARSRALELDRRMFVDALRLAAGRITLRGHVTKPLASRRSNVDVFVQTDCRTRTRVARTKLNRRGRFTVTFPAPAGVPEILVRAQTRVALRRGGPARSRTFTLPSPLVLG